VELLETFVNARLDLAAENYLRLEFFFWHCERITLAAVRVFLERNVPAAQ
jgi:hypothetical protein